MNAEGVYRTAPATQGLLNTELLLRGHHKVCRLTGGIIVIIIRPESPKECSHKQRENPTKICSFVGRGIQNTHKKSIIHKLANNSGLTISIPIRNLQTNHIAICKDVGPGNIFLFLFVGKTHICWPLPLCLQMTEELRQAFRLYDKEQAGYISTAVLKVKYIHFCSLFGIIYNLTIFILS